jgi:hypothetical protein
MVFDVVADGPGWAQWTSIQRSTYEREGVPAPHGVGAIRNFAMHWGPGPNRYRTVSREECIEYDRPRRFSYTLLSGLPIRRYRADVELSADPDQGARVAGVGGVGGMTGAGGTLILWTGTFEPKIPGTGWLIQRFLRRTVQGFADKAARHAEALARGAN